MTARAPYLGSSFEVERVRARLEAGPGGYEIVHSSPGLELGVYVLVAPEPDRQQPHEDDEVYYVLGRPGCPRDRGHPGPARAGSGRVRPGGRPPRLHGLRAAEPARPLPSARWPQGRRPRERPGLDPYPADCGHGRPDELRASRHAGPLGDDELRLLDAYWRAANYLSVGQIYLLDNPLLREPLARGARQAATPRPFRHGARSQPRLRPPEPGDPGARPRRDLRHGPRPRRAGERRERLPRGDVRGALSGHLGGRRGAPQAVPPVLVPGRHPEPRGARDARLDPRGRRARLRARPRVRRGLRQPRPARRLRRRRRRGGDRAARGELALEQVPQPAHATAPCSRSCT